MLNIVAKQLKQNKKALILMLLVVFGLVLVLPQSVLAEEDPASDFNFLPATETTSATPDATAAATPPIGQDSQEWYMDLLTSIIGGINNLLGAFILLPLMNFVVKVIQYNGFMDSYAVQIGWPLVRDLSNMFFVVILLIIAFSTILHISRYHYKTTLLKLVIMALLVNFSKTILGFLIDFAQVIMLTFVNSFKSAAYSAMAYAFGINTMGEVMINTGGETGAEDRFGTVFMNFIFLVVACGVMLAYAAVLLFRIITLWVLVIMSPFAFFAYAFPGLNKYSTEFWTKLIGQLSVGVIMSFLLWLAFQLMAAGVMNTGTTTSQHLGLTADVTDKKLWDSIYTFIVSIALLVLGLQYAQQAGGIAGNFAGKISSKMSDWGTKAVKGIAKAPFKAAKFGAGEAADKIFEKSGVDFNMKRNWERYKAGRADKKSKQLNKGLVKADEAGRQGGFIHSRLATLTGGLQDHYERYGLLGGLKKPLTGKMGRVAQRASDDLIKLADTNKQDEETVTKMIDGKGSAKPYLQEKQQEVDAKIAESQTKRNEIIDKYGTSPALPGVDQELKDTENQLKNLEDQKIEIEAKLNLADFNLDNNDKLKEQLININDEYNSNESKLKSLDDDEDNFTIDRSEALYKKNQPAADKAQSELDKVQTEKAELTHRNVVLDKTRTIAKSTLVNSNTSDAVMDVIKNKHISAYQKDHIAKDVNDSYKKRLNQISAELKPLIKIPRENRTKDEQNIVEELEKEQRSLMLEQSTGAFLSESKLKELKTKKKTFRDNTNQLESEAAKLRPTIGFEAMRATRAMEAEEMKKIEYAKNDQELTDMYIEARGTKNHGRMAAIVKKLAHDGNLNEIVGTLGYNSDSEGYRQFFEKDVRGKGGFSEQHMLSLADDVSYINEQNNQYEIARLISMKNGVRRWSTTFEHMLAAGSEINKKGAREIVSKLNRLGFGGESPDGKFELAPLGANTLRMNATNWVANDRLILEHMNTNLAKKLLSTETNFGSLSQVLGGLIDSKGRNVAKELIRLLNQKLGKQTGQEDVAESARKILNQLNP